MVDGLCDGGIDAWSAFVSRGVWDRSVGGDHKSAGNSYQGANPNDESKLHGAQISADQTPSVFKGM